jgi:hypothetical protein
MMTKHVSFSYKRISKIKFLDLLIFTFLVRIKFCKDAGAGSEEK